jgi:hypothetical protein
MFNPATILGRMKKGQHGGARPRSGPKPKPIGETHRNRVMLNFTDKEFEALGRAAGEQRVSAYLRDFVLRHLARRRKRHQ